MMSASKYLPLIHPGEILLEAFIKPMELSLALVSLSHIAKDAIRVLTFRQPSAEISNSWKSYLAFGLFFTWVAGIGRYWDNPKAD